MYLIIINILFSLLYIVLRSKKNLHILQQNFYNENNRYIKWGFKNIYKVFRLDIILLLVNFINIYLKSIVLVLINVCYILFYIYELKKQKSEQVKISLKITSRIKRLFFTLFMIYFILIVLLFNNLYLFCLINSIFITFNFYVIYLCNMINKPIEKCVFMYYKIKAIRKLNNIQNLDVIGITGSYGKTSSKNILNDILNVKYNVLKTPHNYNTQYGLILTINNYLDKFNDLFIAEMGAFKRGRIKLLCNLVKPKYGIITTIGVAHLETFGSRENIQKGKFELIENLKSGGVGILNMDDPYQVSYKIKNTCEIIWVGIDNNKADLVAKNIHIDSKGMTFDVLFKSDKHVETFETKLLGKNNIYNILSSIALGKKLGMSYNELRLGVKKIKPIEHRLELKKMSNYTIIDDAYNSNPVGSKMALDTLKLMEGFKIVVTPGMIELGTEEYDLNKKFGTYISDVADYVILVGEKQTKPIMEGLIEKKYNSDKIKVINDVKEAFKIIDSIKVKEEKYILLENDLPDIFNEI